MLVGALGTVMRVDSFRAFRETVDGAAIRHGLKRPLPESALEWLAFDDSERTGE